MSPVADDAEIEATSLPPPQGWTNDPEQMFMDYYWQGRPGDLKSLLQAAYKLQDPKPIITRGPETGDVLFLLQNKNSGDNTKYYTWNGIESELCWIKSPTTLKEVYDAINERRGYLGALQFEVMVGGDGDEDEDEGVDVDVDVDVGEEKGGEAEE